MSQPLGFEVLLSDKEFASQLLNNERRISSFSQKAVKELGSIEEQFKHLAQVASGAFAFNELKNLGSQLINVRGEFQQLEIAFETMLGSKAKADRLFGEVVQLAASTPFGLKEAAAATKQLLAYGYASDTVVAELRQLGDIAAGVGAPIGDLAYLMGTLKTQGRAMTVDINQLAGRGIPVWDELSKVLKVNVSEVRNFVEAGKVGYAEVQQVVRNLTNEGGMFSGLMEKQSKSLTGLMSSLGDAIDIMFNQIGESQQGALAGSIGFATSIVQNYEPILSTLKVIIAAYGSYRAAIMLTAAVQSAATAANVIDGYVQLAKHVGIATAAQKAFNGAALANPYAIAAAALIGLVTAIVAFNKEISEADKLQGEYNSKIGQSARADELRRVKVEGLRKAIKDENLSQEERKKKLDELIALSPKHLESLTLANIATEYATQLILDYNKAMAGKNAADTRDAQIMANQAKAAAIRSGSLDKDFGPTSAQRTAFYQAASGSQGQFDVEKETKLLIERNKQEALAALTDQTKKLLAEDGRSIDQRRKIRREASKEEISDVQKTVADYDKVLDELRENQKKSTSFEGFQEIQRQINEAEAKRRVITGEMTKEQKQLAKDADKIGPYGSISYWENIARKAQEIIDKTPSSDTAAITDQAKVKADAEKKVEDIRKSYAVKSFEEELESKKKQFELFNAWTLNYGKDAADKQFAQLISQNRTYLDYLNAEISKLQPFANSPALNNQDAERLGTLLNERGRITGEETNLDAFNERIKQATDNTLTLTEQLEKLAQLRKEIGTPQTEIDFKKVAQISDLGTSLKEQLADALRDFVTEANVQGAKVAQVDKKFSELRSEAKKKYQGEELDNVLKSIDKQHRAEVDGIKDTEFERSEAFKRIHSATLEYGRKEMQERIANIKTALENEKLSIDKRRELELELAQTRRELSKNTADSLREAAGLLSQVMGDTSVQVSKNFAVSMRDISNAVDNVATLMDSSSSTMDEVGSIIGIVTFAITSARDAMLSAKDVATAMDAQVSHYEDLANQLKGINYLLERQKYLLEDLQGIDRAEGVLDLYQKYQQQQQDAFQKLKDLGIETIESQQEVFIDPVFNTKVKNKGFGGFWTQLMTGGKAKTKIEYEFKSLDTSGFDDIEDYVALLAEIKSGGGKLYGKEVVEADIKALEELIGAYNDAVEQQKALMEELKQFYTATTMEQIADSIVDGFIEGKKSAADFASTFEELMINAIRNSLKAQLMDQQLKGFYDKFAEYSLSDYSLSQGELSELKTLYNTIIEEGQKKVEQMEQITGKDISDNEGKVPSAMQGTITGASQESVNILNGQINAMRISAAEHVNVARSQLFELSLIKLNTGNTDINTRQLFTIREDMAEIRRLLGSDFLRAVGGL